MAGFFSSTEQANMINDFTNSFQTWSRSIVIYKEPLKTPNLVPQGTNIFGFGEQQQAETFTYTPVTGIFPAIIRYDDIKEDPNKDSALSPEVMARIYSGPVTIKVLRDCRDFLNNGLTDQVVVDGQMYYMNSDERLQTFQGSEYYIFSLRKTK